MQKSCTVEGYIIQHYLPLERLNEMTCIRCIGKKDYSKDLILV